MPKKPPVRDLPLRYKLGPEMGKGQDNTVYPLVTNEDKPHERRRTGWVAKVNHPRRNIHNTQQVLTETDPRTLAWRGILYKKHAYEISRHFLGGAVVPTAFVLTEGLQGQSPDKRFVELTLQHEVPQMALRDFPGGAPNRVKQRLERLVVGATALKETVALVNGQVAPEARIPLRLDLGEIMQAQTDLEGLTTQKRNSPNLLIDLKSGTVNYIDFGQGQWLPEMDATKQLIFDAHPGFNDEMHEPRG